MSSSTRRVMAGCLMAAGLGLGAGVARAEADALERPAIMSARAGDAVMLAVARAGTRLVAVGERGRVLLSDDNGARWRQVKTPVSVSLTNVSFATAKLGWAVGHSGVVLHSADGGETWAKQLDGRQAAQLVLAEAKATQASAARLAEAERFVADGPDKPFFDVRFVDEQHGLIVGAYGLILATADGGRSWQALLGRLDNPRGKHLYSIAVAGGELLIAGEQGALFVSRDGGQSFATLKTPYEGTFFGAAVSGGGQWFAFGLRGNAYCSSDAGHTWHKTETGAPNTLTAGLRVAGGAVVLTDEAGRLLQGRDCGHAFAALPLANPSPFTGLAQASDGALVLSGVRGMTRGPVLSSEIKP